MTVDTNRMRLGATAIYAEAPYEVAEDISKMLLRAADEIDTLRRNQSLLGKEYHARDKRVFELEEMLREVQGYVFKDYEPGAWLPMSLKIAKVLEAK